MQDLPYSDGCFVCGHENALGLKLRFQATEVGEVRTRCTLPDGYNGFLERAHGGIVSSILDEAMGWATTLRSQRFTYTIDLRIQFRQPVPIGKPLEVRARVVRHTRRISFAEGEILDAAGNRLANSEGKFVMLDQESTDQIAGALIYDPGAWHFDPQDST